MDKQHRKLEREYDRLLTKSIVCELSQADSDRMTQLEEYFAITREVAASLEESQERDYVYEQLQSHSVYEY